LLEPAADGPSASSQLCGQLRDRHASTELSNQSLFFRDRPGQVGVAMRSPDLLNEVGVGLA
jgi:hypothetical protein